jgi:hypothetical protein
MRLHGPTSHTDVDAFVGLAGEDGAILRATWGTQAERDAEWRAEQRAEAIARPHVLVEKLRRAHWSPRPTANPTLLGPEAVGRVLSAAEFSRSRGWLFGMSLTWSFQLMGAGSDAQVKESLTRGLKCLAQWCRDNAEPRAFVAVVENGPRIGLHAHVVLHVPVPKRRAFRTWVEGWVRAECERWGVEYERKAWELNRSGKEYPLAHYMLAHYAVKGCDSGAVVQTATEAPDGRAVLLRDVLACEYHDPGIVSFERLYIGASINERARGEWRSAWERGERDVNFLYPPEFLKHVRLRCPVATLGAGELAPVRAAATAVCEWYERVKPLGDVLPPETQGWQTVVERNVELVTVALRRVCTQFELAAALRDPHDRARARAALRAEAELAYRAVNTNGEDSASVVEDHDLPLGRLAVRRLAAAEAALRELGARLGVDTAYPSWVAQMQLPSLAI